MLLVISLIFFFVTVIDKVSEEWPWDWSAAADFVTARFLSWTFMRTPAPGSGCKREFTHTRAHTHMYTYVYMHTDTYICV